MVHLINPACVLVVEAVLQKQWKVEITSAAICSVF